MPRPSMLTPERHAIIVDALNKGLSRKAAAGYAGVSEDTIYTWMDRGRQAMELEETPEREIPYRQFAEDVERADAGFEEGALAVIQNAALDGTWQAAAWMLERKWPKTFGRRIAAEVTGADGGPIEVTSGRSVIEMIRQLAAANPIASDDEDDPAAVDAEVMAITDGAAEISEGEVEIL